MGTVRHHRKTDIWSGAETTNQSLFFVPDCAYPVVSLTMSDYDYDEWEMGRGYDEVYGTDRPDSEGDYSEDEYPDFEYPDYDDAHFGTPWTPREATERASARVFGCANRAGDIECDALFAFFKCTAHYDNVYIKVDRDGDVLPEPCGCMKAADETGDCEWEFSGYLYTNHGLWLPVYKILYFDAEGQYHDYQFHLRIVSAFAASINPCTSKTADGANEFHQVGQKQALVKSVRFGQQQPTVTKSASKC